jgi:16S rRNA (cytosine967-C5)-methyltransferase
MINPRKSDRESLRRVLAEQGTEARESDLSPLALSVVSGNPLRSALFAEGHFTIQDLGSQALPLLLPPGETLVDLAAAPGGKSFAALALGRARRTISVDRSAERLLLLVQNRERLGFPEALPVCADVRSLPLLHRSTGRILFDAPCSGTGTLRKNPEIRYRVTPAAIERLSRAQEEALAAAAALLAPRGLLLYSTCSLEEEENERVVRRVLARDAGLEPAPIEASGPLGAHVEGARFRIFPNDHSDGFTAHLIRRRA